MDGVPSPDRQAREQAALISFADLFRHLRLIHGLSQAQMARVVHYSVHSVEINETTTRNPSTKTLMRYIQPLKLELIIGRGGLTIRDPKTDLIVIKDWTPEFDLPQTLQSVEHAPAEHD